VWSNGVLTSKELSAIELERERWSCVFTCASERPGSKGVLRCGPSASGTSLMSKLIILVVVELYVFQLQMTNEGQLSATALEWHSRHYFSQNSACLGMMKGKNRLGQD